MFKRNKPAIGANCTKAIADLGMGKYQINTMPTSDEMPGINRITEKIAQLLHDEGVTYKEAMQIPAHLKAYLSIAFQDDMLNALVNPISCASPDKSHKGDQDGNQ